MSYRRAPRFTGQANPYIDSQGYRGSAGRRQTSQGRINSRILSKGKANYCLKALLAMGFIKMQSSLKRPNKLAYAYLLTNVGMAEKADLKVCFF